MKQDILIAVLVITFIIVISMKRGREEYTQTLRGMAGYTKPVTDLNIDDNPDIDLSGFSQEKPFMATRDLINRLLKQVHEFINTTTGLCVYPIETNKIEKYTDEDGRVLYKCRFMFTTTKGFVFGIGVEADFIDDKLVSTRTQPLHTDDDIKPYTEVYYPFAAYQTLTDLKGEMAKYEIKSGRV